MAERIPMSTLTLHRHNEATQPLRLLSNAASAATQAVTITAKKISSQLLLDGARELVIQHQGNEYHLRLTRNDKLILTK
ncbi:hypothetical protein DYGSA30_17750 [Dyella sp. GSA-30]|jgi:hemin uptake protein HemP|nr:hypothetical protein DYGSA30_17750 [Dyella sp. GSA-30]